MNPLISFDDVKAGAKSLKKLVQAFTRAGAPVASIDPSENTRRTSGITYRQVMIAFADNQTVTLGIKTTGDIYEVRVNGSVLPIKAQDDQIKAVGEIVKALDAGRAKFQAKLAAQKVALPKGITTAAPKMEEALQQAQTDLDTQIADAKARANELRTELGEPLLDDVAEELDPAVIPAGVKPWGTTWLGFKIMDRAAVMERAPMDLPSAYPIADTVNVMLDDGSGGELRVAGTVVSANFRAGKVTYSIAVPISPQPQQGRQLYAVIPDILSECVTGASAGARSLDSAGFGEVLQKAAFPVLDSAAGARLLAGDLSGAEIDVMAALAKRGPLEDGDIPSKSGRDALVERGLVEREEGNNALTPKGRGAAALLDAANLTPGIDVPWDSFADPAVVEAKGIAERIIAGEALDYAAFSESIAQLRVALDVVETNYPINLARGDLGQAELEEHCAEDFRRAIDFLQKAQAGAA